MNFYAPKSQAQASGWTIFHSFTMWHLIYLFFCAVIIIAVMLLMKRRSIETREKSLSFLCIFLPCCQAFRIGWEVYAGVFTWQYSLPFQMCSSMSLIALLYYITKNSKFLDYFFIIGLPSAAAAILFPNLNGSYPVFYYYTWQYFFHHSLIMLIALMYVFICGHRPKIKTVWFSGLILAVFIPLCIVLNNIINKLLNLPPDVPNSANYCWLTFGAPGTPLALIEQITGPRFYMPGLFVFAIIIFGLMYAPFILADMRRKK